MDVHAWFRGVMAMSESIFESITLIWKGEEKTVEPEKVMKLIASIEQHIKIQELLSGPALTSLAEGYAAALRYAGFRVSGEQVYEALFNKESSLSIQESSAQLLTMMMPPSTYRPTESEKETGKAEAETGE